MPEVFHHRATLKQTNKAFKSKHATKSSLKEVAKGRAPRQSPKSAHANNAAAQNKLSRRNTARQTQATKRAALVSSTRVFSGTDGAPRIVAVIPLTEDVDPHAVARALAESVDVGDKDSTKRGLWKIRAERFKTSLQFIQISYGRLYAALDACKVADYVVLALSPSVEVTPWGDTLLRTLQAQGLPTVVAAVAPGFLPDPKTRPGVLKSLLSFVQYFAPEQTRVFDLNAQADRLSALRAVAEGKPRDVRWREGRAWVIGENVAWQAGTSTEEGELAVTGVVRGGPLSANRLMHLPNFGDFQIAKIESAPVPRRGQDMDVEPAVLGQPDDDADSLVSSNDPDDMANEQTWPTEEEMHGSNAEDPGDGSVPDATNATTAKAPRKIPKGMSEYQASWILDDDNEDDEGEGGDEDGEDSKMQDDDEEEMVDMPAEEDETELDSHRSAQFEELDADEEERQLETWRTRKREEQDDLEFPDEIDTPQDIPARTRFQRYRGMRSFRTSPWDPYENLPRDYARIFQFEDFRRTERTIRRRAEQDAGAVQPGLRVTITLKGVPREAAYVDPAAPLVLFGLHQHEHKKTVLNFAVQRNTEYDGSVRSKDPLVLCIGPRRLRVRPVYSQLTRGGGKGANNVHKFERYLRQGQTYVATVYGPVAFGNQPCVLLRETEDAQAPALVAMGSFINPDPTRVVAKRIVLSGHPFKVHKKTATVRYIFFNSDDVLYFKPIQLHTKYGRIGHIRESLGTHGYFKAHFDGPINQMDTVCMSLYKRVFPRWCELYKEPGRADHGDDAIMEE